MVEAGTERDSGRPDRSASDSARLPDFSASLSVNPLLAHPAAAMAAVRAIGFGIANQMAGAFFGALQSALETANRLHSEETGSTDAKPVEEPNTAVPTQVEPAEVAIAPVADIRPKATRARQSAAPKAIVAVKRNGTAGVKTSAKAKPQAADISDLKRISGIGPKLEKVLKGRGVVSLADVAAWTEADIARIETELGLDGRIGRDDWVGKAKALLK